MSYGDQFVFTLFTNDPQLAARADAAGIDRIGVDIERLGKHLRQASYNWISDHAEADVEHVRPSIKQAALFARCNPIHPASRDEIDRLIASGVSVLMLPYFKGVQEAETFIRMVDGRATPVLLVETREAAAVMPELCRLEGVNEIHIGLNDMRLSLGWPSHFQVLVSDFLERLCEPVLHAGFRLGIGGVGRVGDNDLPIPSDLVIAQLPRLGATATLISRAFFRGDAPLDLGQEISALRRQLDVYAGQPKSWLQAQRKVLSDMCGTSQPKSAKTQAD
jgi:hypothetical protein